MRTDIYALSGAGCFSAVINAVLNITADFVVAVFVVIHVVTTFHFLKADF